VPATTEQGSGPGYATPCSAGCQPCSCFTQCPSGQKCYGVQNPGGGCCGPCNTPCIEGSCPQGSSCVAGCCHQVFG
jgi:hypothetical protein